MGRRISLLWVASLVVCAAVNASAQEPPQITAGKTKDHIGAKATVCGLVASTRHAANDRGQPTFLNIDKPYPDQLFTIVIWGEHRSAFPQPPEQAYRDKKVCVTGTIEQYQNKPQIVARSPAAIRVVESDQPRVEPAQVTPPKPASRPRACCRTCRKGKACGDSCIARNKTCRKGPGCACNGEDRASLFQQLSDFTCTLVTASKFEASSKVARPTERAAR